MTHSMDKIECLLEVEVMCADVGDQVEMIQGHYLDGSEFRYFCSLEMEVLNSPDPSKVYRVEKEGIVVTNMDYISQYGFTDVERHLFFEDKPYIFKDLGLAKIIEWNVDISRKGWQNILVATRLKYHKQNVSNPNYSPNIEFLGAFNWNTGMIEDNYS